MNIGCHLSVGDGYLEMGTVAKSIGANTFQFFTRNPRGGGVKPINTEDMADLCQFLKDEKFAKIVAHAPFVVNLSAKEETKRNYAVSVLEDDIMRMELLPYNYYNLHPGCHVGQGVDVGIEYVSDGLNKALYKDMTTMVLLETMAGVGTELGRSFEELKAIYDRVELKEKLGFCLDTCHIFDGGYDIVGNLDNVVEEFDRILGIENLKAIHLNDSKNPLGSHKDRHEKIGQGNIGIDAIVAILSHPALCNLPFILETPNETEGYAEEIKLLKSLVK